MMKKINTFALIALLAIGSQAAGLNEWMFDLDFAGRTLSQATNSGTHTAVFSADTAPVTQTDGARGLICANDVSDTGSLWTNGAVLTADVTNQASGVLYLRYDFNYDMTSVSNNTGTLLGLAFSDGTSTNLAGIVLEYDLGSPNVAPPTGVKTSEIATLDPEITGYLSVIAKVDLGTQMMSAWYDLSGGNTFNPSDSPDATTAINLATIDDLVFWATGDFIATASNKCVVVDNIRTAATWDEVTKKPANLLRPPEFAVSISDSLGGGMSAGQTNEISVTIYNSGSAATEAVSTLVHNGGAGLSIISSNNAAVPINAGGSVVQTFSVKANTNGPYVLTAQAYEGGVTNGAPATFDLFVGSRVSFYSYVLTNETGVVNMFPGEAEPGETFDLIITSINDGGLLVTGITNSLTPANSSFFPSVLATNSNTYALLNNGDTTSTTYRVTCAASTPDGLKTFTVINRTAGDIWADQLQIDVRRDAVLSVSPGALTLNVFSGEMNSGSVTLTNAGNDSADYTVVFPTPFPGSIYAATETRDEDRYPFLPGADFDVFTSWSGTQTTEMDIGFSFAPFGVAYTRFSVSQTGTVTLKTAGGTTATLKPFETATLSAQSTMRYKMINGRLMLAWGNGTGQEFQAWINANGTVLYLYEYGTWGLGTIGSVTAGNTQTFSHTPGQTGRDGLLLTAAQWVSASGGTIGAQTSQPLTFTADAREIQSASNVVFTATIYGGSTPQTVSVTVNVSATASPGITISPLSFSGPAGSITHTNMTLTNTGNVALNYILTDSGLESAGYTMDKFTPFPWNSIPPTSEYVLDAATLDTLPVAIGFPFTFFGSVYTNLTVGVDGTLTLGTNQVIVPFSASLTTNSSSSIRAKTNDEKTEFTVIWEGMLPPGGGDNQTFQAVLYRDTGVIRFNYDQLTGNWPDGVIYLDKDINASGSVTGTLSNNETTVTSNVVTTTTTYTTNAATGFVTGTKTDTTNTVVSYADDANRQSIQFIPGKQHIISATPRSGTIPVGSASLIDVIGNAKTLIGGGTNPVVASTSFKFDVTGATHSWSTSRVSTVTFTATNSVDGTYPPVTQAMAAAMWGAEEPLVSSVQNSGGSRTLSWPGAGDGLSRIYTIEYTTSLSKDWIPLAVRTNTTSYVDTENNDEPVIFYRVTVQP
jgi:hypothetical protein